MLLFLEWYTESLPLYLGTLLFSLLNLVAYVPFLGSLIFRKVSLFHRQISSDIPGNPHCFDNAIISLMRTLPEPSNFNLVWTSLPINEPLVIRGRLPKSRINSISLYGQNSSEPPNSIDLGSIKTKEDDSFELSLSRDPTFMFPPDAPNWGRSNLSTNKWERGIVSMRNYVVPAGTSVQTPEIVRLSDGVVVRRSQTLLSGPAQFDLRSSKFFIALCRIVPLNIIFYHTLLGVSFKIRSSMVFFGLLLSVVLYHVLFILGYMGLKRTLRDICNEKNTLVLASLESGSKASQPSTLHTYWVMEYTIADGDQLSIQGKIDPSYQQYWSVVVYDQCGLPLPRYVYDENVSRIPIKNRSIDRKQRDTERYEYDIRLTNRGSQAGANERDGTTEIDVTTQPQGYVIFRLVHPTTDQATTFSAPITSYISSNDYETTSINAKHKFQ